MEPVVLNIEKYVYEKVHKADAKINIPQEPVFFQEYNNRVTTAIIPQFATWDDNRVWEVKVIEVTDKCVSNTIVRTSPKELSDEISRFEMKNRTPEDFLKEKVIRYLMDFFTDDRISKESFTHKYESQTAKVKELFI